MTILVTELNRKGYSCKCRIHEVHRTEDVLVPSGPVAQHTTALKIMIKSVKILLRSNPLEMYVIRTRLSSIK